MQRIFVAGSIIAGSLLAVACGSEADAPRVGADNTTVATLPTEPNVPGEFYPIVVDGMPCVLWMYVIDPDGHGKDSMSGLTCDWSER